MALLSHFDFTETSGTTLHDIVGGHHLTLTDVVFGAVSGITHAGQFNGSTSKAIGSYAYPFTETTPYTFTGKFKRASANNTGTIIEDTYHRADGGDFISNLSYSVSLEGTTTQGGINISIKQLGVVDATYTRAFVKFEEPLCYDTNWHTFAFTYDGSCTIAGLNLYIDGVKITGWNMTADNFRCNNPEPYRVHPGFLRLGNSLGQSNSEENFFNGYIANIKVYDTEVTDYLVLYPPTNLRWESGTYDSGDLYWDAASTSGDSPTGYAIQYKPVHLPDWQHLDTVDAQTLHYNITSLPLPNGITAFRVCSINDDNPECFAFSSCPTCSDGTIWQRPPVSLSIDSETLTCTSMHLYWYNQANAPTTEDNKIMSYENGSWVTLATVSHDDSDYLLTGLTPNHLYTLRVVAVASGIYEMPSESIEQYTTDPTPVIVSAIPDYTSCSFTWTMNCSPEYGTAIRPEYREFDVIDWITKPLLSSTATTYTLTGLQPATWYSFRVVRIGSEYPSVLITFKTLEALITLPDFCSNEYGVIIPSDCGYSSGQLGVPTVYVIYYNFLLIDIFGNNYILDASDGTFDYFTNLPASWYSLTATVKHEWRPFFTNDGCTKQWIQIPDNSTTISLTSLNTQNSICGGFGSRGGRVNFCFADTSDSTSWVLTLFDFRGDQIYEQTVTDICTIVVVLNSGSYFGLIENDNGCTYIIDEFDIKKEDNYTNVEITELYLTKWDSILGWNYYDSSSYDWYVSGVDTKQFTSTKISEYFDLPDVWYQIKLDTAKVVYNQTLTKGSNGILFNEKLTINISHTDSSKWLELTSILKDRYIIVFKDANDRWWTMGYIRGAGVNSYKIENNQYLLEFTAPSINKTLTTIDQEYVKNYIL